MAAPLTAVRARLLPVSCAKQSTTAPSPRKQQQLLPPPATSSRGPPPPPSPLLAAVPAAVVPLMLTLPPDAQAAGGELGILEGRSVALLHPLVMGGLFAYTLWAGYLGWQWRRVRTVQDEINELKKQVKPAATPAAVGGAGDAPPPAPKSAVEVKIDELAEERKKLLKGSFRDRHFNAGSILLGLGVLESVGGALNTWIRTGKLFPGPHLFAGAGSYFSRFLPTGALPSFFPTWDIIA
jgi:hypothetical protein